MKLIKRWRITEITDLGTATIMEQEYLVREDENETPIGEPHAMGVTPIDRGNLVGAPQEAINILNYLWTDEVVSKYRAFISSNDEDEEYYEESS